ncbi:NACHT domain-containing protein [Gordonia terrae]
MSDGGRDVTARGPDGAPGGTIYQVKWSKDRIKSPVAWLRAAVEGEAESIERLVANGATRYVLMTCVAGTSTPDTGTIDRLDSEFAALSTRFGITMEPLWQADIDGMVDGAPDAIKWSYQEMLAGPDLIRFLLHGSSVEGRAAEMRTTLLRVMKNQGVEDAKVKFSQADLDQTPLAEVYVDVTAELVSGPRAAPDLAGLSTYQDRAVGALEYLLHTSMPYTVVRGEPGQGKSTLGQYLCQVHRAHILPEDDVNEINAGNYNPSEPRLPFRVDLRHYATWMEGFDPYDDSPHLVPGKRRRGVNKSLEHFLVDYCRYYSGGRTVNIEQIQDLLDRYPALIVLDGLDEVGDQRLRSQVVDEIDRLTRRLGAVRRRRTQMVVTTRPNSSSQPEPDKELFEYIRLEAMSPAMQTEYLRKWAAVNGLPGPRRRKLTRVFLGRTAERHIAQLSANPMHLTILLYLINKRGEAVPSARTAIYSAYMDALMDREIERDQIDKDDVDRVHETTSWLGWRMHSGVETDPSLGKLPLKRIRRELFSYLQEVEGPEQLLDKLFQASADRFWALTSKEGETYEFAVQPVREYFAARYLAKYAGMLSFPVLKGTLLAHLIERPYWLNTALFYAGFADPNEVGGLVIGLEATLQSGRHPLQARVGLWSLVRDGVFAPVSIVQRKAAQLLTDDLSLCLIGPERLPEQFPPLPAGLATTELLAALYRLLVQNAASSPRRAQAAARLIGEVDSADRSLVDWLSDCLCTATDVEEQSLLAIGAAHRRGRLPSSRTDSLGLKSAESRRAALAIGVIPRSGSHQDKALLRAVLDGEASDTTTTSASHGGALLRAVRPHRFIDLAKADGESRFLVPTAHLQEVHSDKNARQSSFSRLKSIDDRYKVVQHSSLFRRGQQDSTSPWQDTARGISAIHGPCWLATEIALIGVANGSVRTGGTFDPKRPAFGLDMDYGVYVQKLRGGQNVQWWCDASGLCSDNNLKMAWIGGVLVACGYGAIESLLPVLEVFIESLGRDEFSSALDGLSRICASGLATTRAEFPQTSQRELRRLALGTRSIRLRAALILFTASLGAQDPLAEFNTAELVELAAFGAASWPAHRALTERLLAEQSLECLDAVKACGPCAVVEVPDEEPDGFPSGHIEAVLEDPLSFPRAWVVAAERWHSRKHAEKPLERVGVAEGWLPDL